MLSKADAEAVRSQNRRLATDHFRRFPVSTRRRLSDETGLSLSAASAITSDVVRKTVLGDVEIRDTPARRGRPEVSVAVRGGAYTMVIDPLPIAFVGSSAGAMDLMEPAIRRGIRESAIEGIGDNVPFTVIPDADALLLEASIVLALSAVDEEMSRNPAAGLGVEAA